LFWLVGGTDSVGEGTLPLLARQTGVTTNEMACYSNKLFIEREKSAHALAGSGRSFVAEQVLGECCEAKGQYPEALYHYRKARAMVESMPGFRNPPVTGKDLHWHTLILYSLARLQGGMGQLDAERELLAGLTNRVGREYCALTLGDPDAALARLVRNRLKAGDVDVAYALAAQALRDHPDDPGAMHNMAIVLLEKEPDGGQAYALYRKLLGTQRIPGVASCDWMGRMAESQARLGEAEEWLRRSARMPGAPDDAYDGWRAVARLQTGGARFAEAKDSLTASGSIVAGKQYNLRREMRLRTLGAVAEWGLATGAADLAADVTEILCREQTRSGPSMQGAASRQAGFCVLRLEALKQQMHSGVLRVVGAAWERELKRRELVAIVSQAVSTGTRFHDVFEVVDVPPWLFGNVFDALGYNASLALVRTYPLHGARMQSYDTALIAEISRVGKNWNAAKASAISALQDLPAEERLLRARMTLIAALCANEAGQEADGARYVQEACAIAPASPSWMGIPPPAGLKMMESLTVEEISRLKGERD
jgi:tetratricopeptide (TPR) repeat protein